MASYRIGIDVGGTFTDLVLLNEESGEVHHTKVLTSYPNPAEGVLRALDRALEETGVRVKMLKLFFTERQLRQTLFSSAGVRERRSLPPKGSGTFSR